MKWMVIYTMMVAAGMQGSQGRKLQDMDLGIQVDTSKIGEKINIDITKDVPFKGPDEIKVDLDQPVEWED